MVAGFLGGGILFLSYSTEDFLLVSSIALGVALLFGSISSYFWSETRHRKEQLVRNLKSIEWIVRLFLTLIFFGIGFFMVPSGKLFSVIGIYLVLLGFIASGLGVFGYMVSRK